MDSFIPLPEKGAEILFIYQFPPEPTQLSSPHSQKFSFSRDFCALFTPLEQFLFILIGLLNDGI